MSKSIVLKGLQILDDSDNEAPTVIKSKAKKDTKKPKPSKSDTKSSEKWGLKKKQKLLKRLEQEKQDKGKVKHAKLDKEKKKSRVEKILDKKNQDATKFNLRMLSQMSSKKVKTSVELERCFDFQGKKAGTSSSRSSSRYRIDEPSVFTDADFANFVRDYRIS